ATPCSIRLPAAATLPNGILYAPESMDQKWVIAWRDGHVIVARSWTGEVNVVADASLVDDELVIESIRTVADAPFTMVGDLADTFEWLLRTHALQQRIPLPVHDVGADLLENAPLLAFSLFGNVVFCAAKSWNPPPPSLPLRSAGRVVQAARKRNLDELKRAVDAGEDVDAPSLAGYTALHVAILQSNAALFEALLELGADPHQRADHNTTALHLAVVSGAPTSMLTALEATNIDLQAANDDGFTALHGAAEVDNDGAVDWLTSRGLDVEMRSTPGHTPLQIACALGHLKTAKALYAAGASPAAESPNGTAIEIATAEGRDEVATWLRSLPANPTT
ncbi:MAG: ankyrin repeat domain-containing protein, partial [Candidatus Devosia euplotis]|nr:ankyrin repeat domain-containing protein [Candidatus Devosia euplotis]